MGTKLSPLILSSQLSVTFIKSPFLRYYCDDGNQHNEPYVALTGSWVPYGTGVKDWEETLGQAAVGSEQAGQNQPNCRYLALHSALQIHLQRVSRMLQIFLLFMVFFLQSGQQWENLEDFDFESQSHYHFYSGL